MDDKDIKDLLKVIEDLANGLEYTIKRAEITEKKISVLAEEIKKLKTPKQVYFKNRELIDS